MSGSGIGFGSAVLIFIVPSATCFNFSLVPLFHGNPNFFFFGSSTGVGASSNTGTGTGIGASVGIGATGFSVSARTAAFISFTIFLDADLLLIPNTAL